MSIVESKFSVTFQLI